MRGSKGPGLKSDPGGGVDSGVEKSSESHAALHQVFAIETEFVRVVIGVSGEERGDGIERLHAADEVIIDERAVRDLRAGVGTRKEFLRALEGGEVHVDRDVAIGVAVDLDAGAMDFFDPGVQVVLRCGDVALVVRAWIVDAEGHRAFGEGTVDGVFGRGAEADPFVAETGLDAGGDHGIQFLACGFITDAVFQVAIRAHFLHRGQTAAFVVHAGYPVSGEHFRDVRRRLAISRLPASSPLFTWLSGACPPGENALSVIGDTAVERARRVLVKRAARRIRCLAVDVRHFKSFGVVEGGVAAAMVNGDGVVLGNLVEVVDRELAAILHFGVIEEIAFNPRARRRLRGAGAELLDDAVDGDELDFEGIADQDFVQQRGAPGVVVRVDEAGDDGARPCASQVGVPVTDQVADVGIGSDGEKAAVLDRERLGAGLAGVDGDDPGVEDDEFGAGVEELSCCFAKSEGVRRLAPVRVNSSRRVMRSGIV